MNPAVAFARTRELPRAALVALVLAVAASALTESRVGFPDVRYLVDYSVPVAALVPVAHAVVLATTLHSPMADLERHAAQPMALYRRLHVVALTLFALLLAALPLAFGLPTEVFTTSARNAVGHLGLAVISARFFGNGMAWLLPLGTFGPTLLLGVRADNTPEWWAWAIHGPSAGGAAAVAAVLWLVALLLPGGPPRAEERGAV
ncbi:hypothetical protein [Streptomyces sp. NPDC002490]|uniref:hypothetical protein n=1 Tax=Streptomyces sp. NPDC002490 TaxID=3154416 RepID=UPI003328E61E